MSEDKLIITGCLKNNYSANNFSGNYLGTELFGLHYIYTKQHFYDNFIHDYRTNKYDVFNYKPGILLFWGINTRINRFLFFDFAPYVGYSFDKDLFMHDYQFGIRLKAALSYGFN